jgi:hypothetical protein
MLAVGDQRRLEIPSFPGDGTLQSVGAMDLAPPGGDPKEDIIAFF